MKISKKFALSLLEDWQKAGQKSYLRRDHVSCSMYISSDWRLANLTISLNSHYPLAYYNEAILKTT